MATVPLAGKRIGLVLSGGGAKGAYEIGVWRALTELGITRFSAIAGTSIGGLNGYLVARGDFDQALRLWRRLGVRSPFKLSVLRLAFGYLERVGIAAVMAITTFVLLPAVGGVALALIAGLIWAGSRLPHVHFLRGALPIASVVIVLGVARLLRRTRLGRVSARGVPYSVRDHRRFVFFSGMTPGMYWLFGVGLLVAIPAWICWRDAAAGKLPETWWSLLPVIFVSGLLAIALILEPGLSSLSQIPVFEGDVLPETLDRFLKRDTEIAADGTTRLKIAPHLFVSRLTERWISLPGSLTRIIPGRPSMTSVLGLEYEDLRGAAIPHARGALRSTGAIAGFLPRVYQDRAMTSFEVHKLPHVYYDAGMVDNTPLAPLLEHELCDVIVVVLLDHTISDPRDYLARHVDTINRRLRDRNRDISDEVWYEGLAGTRFIFPARVSSDNFEDVRIIPIVPSRSLGGFFTGTLRFNLARVEAHIDLGARDTHAAMARELDVQVAAPLSYPAR